MTAEDLARLAEGRGDQVKRRGNWYDARCPGHEDEHPSLSFRDSERGLVLKCHAGCPHEAIAAGFGLEPGALSWVNGARAATRVRIVETYPYCDEMGNLLYEVVRLEPKAFRQRRPDGSGGWIWKLDGARRVLYQLPALQGQGMVYVVEGEKDVERLRSLGLPATTNPSGAGKWRQEYSAQLKAAKVRSVVVLPDNDKPGEEHAVGVAESCRSAGLDVQVVRLPGLRPKGDVSDWFAAGHTAAELFTLARKAPFLSGTAPGYPAPVLIRLSEIEPERLSWLWPGRLARGKVTLLVGDPGLGKSFVTLDAGARISTGREWPDGGPAPLGEVILLNAEDGLADTIRPRVDVLQGDAARFHILRAVLQEDAERPFSLGADLPALEKALIATRAVLVIIDPVSAYLGKTDSYKDAEVRGLLAPLARLAERHAVAVLGVMHLTKDTQRRAIHRAGGSVAFVGAARVVLAVGKDQGDEVRRLLVPVKTNLSAPPASLAYRIAGLAGEAAHVEWEPEPVRGVEADTLLGAEAPEDRAERRDADELLRELLAEGERPSLELFKAARANGVSERTLHRAKRRLGIKARREGVPGKKGGRWYWFLPGSEWSPSKTATDQLETATYAELAAFEQQDARIDETARPSRKAATAQSTAAFDDSLRGDGSLRGAAEEVDPWEEP